MTRIHKARRFQGHVFVNAKKAAEIIGVTQTTFSAWHKKGIYIPKLESKDFGARTFYAVSSLRKFASEYHPHARVKPEVETKPLRPYQKPNKDKETLELILEVLTNLQKMIEQLKK